jgi:uncharacterized protein (TIGR02284 family)
MKYTESISNRLSELLTKNYDAEARYAKAAKIVDTPQLKRFFETQAQNRYDFGYELNSEINSVGGSLNKGPHNLGGAHRAWMSIKDAFTSNDEESILGEVIKGEKTAVDEYKDVLNNSTLPPSTKIILIRQVDNIESALRSSEHFEVVFV